ncbi:MAG TPA: hypothetical protein D7H89_02680, partial [Candidatus Poseidoniales archaeon]
QLQEGHFQAEDPTSVRAAITKRSAFIEALPCLVSDANPEMLEHFKTRRGLIEVVEQTTRSWSITESG